MKTEYKEVLELGLEQIEDLSAVAKAIDEDRICLDGSLYDAITGFG